VEQRARQPARGARRTEAQEHATIHVRAKSPEAERGGEKVRNRDRGDGELRSDPHCEERREQAPDAEPHNRRDSAGQPSGHCHDQAKRHRTIVSHERADALTVLRIFEQAHETIVHVQGLVAVEERRPRIVRGEI
jgi:hypothetical protein